MQLVNVFLTYKNYIMLSKKNIQLYILGSWSSVPGDPNSVFWLAQKCLSLVVCVALIKMLVASWCNGLWLDIHRLNHFNFVLSKVFPLKSIYNHFYITIIHKSIFFNWDIPSLPYLGRLLISMMKSLFSFFLSDRNDRCCFL